MLLCWYGCLAPAAVDCFSSYTELGCCPTQSCILAIGGTHKEAIVGEDGAVTAASLMRVTLSADHRVVDGALAAEWLQAFKGYIENPLSMLV